MTKEVEMSLFQEDHSCLYLPHAPHIFIQTYSHLNHTHIQTNGQMHIYNIHLLLSKHESKDPYNCKIIIVVNFWCIGLKIYVK